MRYETATFTNMCMIEKDGKVVVQDRISPSWPGVTFPGGHVEIKESFVDALKREVREETGLEISNIELCGIKQFTTSQTGRYVVLLYRATTATQELQSSEEGEIFWVSKDDIYKYKLAEGFEEMLKVFFGQGSEVFFEEKEDVWSSVIK